MSTVNLNLARKWRSRTFDQVIGQDLTVRIVKNSLYLNHIFPVYLLSGQHGCGKTTMARIFATALNCELLESFQKDPKKHAIPCLNCSSCKAMQEGKHPDFIEIDGASHTGIDNVRHIIDVSSFLPLMGKRKIYLIDEAHMLSKAAFNAFLKILEEPPVSVVFMLATTELYKIIDTVKSRSFHLFFRGVRTPVLVEHLENVCKQERIHYDLPGLTSIVQQTGGSVRDALNLLEQVRLESNRVTQANVAKVLGHVSHELILGLVEQIIVGTPEQILNYIQEHELHKVSADVVWKMVIAFLNAAVWYAFKVTMPADKLTVHPEKLMNLAYVHDSSYYRDCLKLLYEHELAFVKTASPWNFLEVLLLECCFLKKTMPKVHYEPKPIKKGVSEPMPKTSVKDMVTSVPKQIIASPIHQSKNQTALWDSFITHIENLDPLLCSIFKQGSFGGYDESSSVLIILFSQDFIFFKEMLDNSSSVWKPLLTSLIGKTVTVNALFNEPKKEQSVKPVIISSASVPTPIKQSSSVKIEKTNIEKKKSYEQGLDISDKELWKKATLLKEMFSGTVYELQKGHDE